MNPKAGVWSLVSAAEMQALDRHTIDELGVPGALLMESAGRGLIGPLMGLRQTSDRPEEPVVILCGGGNNGGDGFVLARHLLAEGIPTRVVRIVRPGPSAAESGVAAESAPASESLENWRRLERIDAPRETVDVGHADPSAFLGPASVVVDALFGTGLSRPLEGPWLDWVRAIEEARGDGARVLAVDLPSGLCADTGQPLGGAVRADLTVTISAPKIGLALEPGRSLAGERVVVRVGIADAAPGTQGSRVSLWSPQAAADHWPERPVAGHKGSFGRVLVAGGSPGLLGAVGLTARGALRTGAGLVTVAHPQVGLPPSQGTSLPEIPTEAMSHALAAASEGEIDQRAIKDLLELTAARDAVAFGPGLGRAASLRVWVPEFVASVEASLVIDADGLHALAGQLGRLRDRSGETILTPHPGEAATLLGIETASIGEDRVGVARRLAEEAGCVAVLKGAGTVVAAPGGAAHIIPTGGPILASGGTGDVLTGIVVALLAQGVPAFEAAVLGAWWHGATADRLRGDAPGRVEFGMLASELADALPGTIGAARDALAERSRPSVHDAQSNEEGRHGGLLLRFP